MTNFKELPDLEYLKSKLKYNPEDGTFEKIRTCFHCGSTSLHPLERQDSKGYGVIAIGGHTYRAHRLAWLLYYGEEPKDNQIDHIDRDKTNNKISNLRLCSNLENNQNKESPKNSNVRFRPDKHKSKPWRGRFVFNKKDYEKHFECPLMARLWVIDKKKELGGEFCPL